MKIVLGSQSPWRKKILEKMGYTFDVLVSDFDEKSIRFDDPVKLTLALANAKAEVLVPKLKEDTILITSDQVVVCNGKILEKPVDEKEAREYIEMYANYPAETVTSVVVIRTGINKKVEGTDIAKIWMKLIPKDIAEKYIATKDPFLHAGGFDHEYPLISSYVSHIEGEPESISGLPKKLTVELINLVNLDV